MIDKDLTSLLKDPSTMQANDFAWLKDIVQKYPYVQSFRALELYGTHLYDKAAYPESLTTTAAYTTDKKILYQLINGKPVEVKPLAPKQDIIQDEASQADDLNLNAPDNDINFHDTETFSEESSENIVTKPSEESMQEGSDVDMEEFSQVEDLNMNAPDSNINYHDTESFLSDEQDVLDPLDVLIINENEEPKTYGVHSIAQDETPVVNENDSQANDLNLKAPDDTTNFHDTETFMPDVKDDSIDKDPENVDETDSATDFKEESSQADDLNLNAPDSDINFHDTETFMSDVKDDSTENVSENIDESDSATDFKEEVSQADDLNLNSPDSEINFHDTETFMSDVQDERTENVSENVDETNSATDFKEESSQADDLNLNAPDSDINFHDTETFMSDVKDDSTENVSENIDESDSATDFKEEVSQADDLNLNAPDDSINFHDADQFMPSVGITASKPAPKYTPSTSENRHEAEMKRLLAEVEEKMKAKKFKSINKTDDEESGNEISFAETPAFEINPSETRQAETKKTFSQAQDLNLNAPDSSINFHDTESFSPSEKENSTKNIPSNVEEEKDSANTDSNWKPMSFVSPKPDSEQKVSAKQNVDEYAPSKEEVTDDGDNAKVLNVSFFSPTISVLSDDEKEETAQAPSNVPSFINTWQKWLKIEREENNSQAQTSNKDEVINKFIEESPKISQLKKDQDFVVKEKKQDINHLMTETLAQLYVNQKLYAKAIDAYEVLQQKHPEKSEEFQEKINQIIAQKGR